MAERNDLVKEN
jgi:hypothetical protein